MNLQARQLTNNILPRTILFRIIKKEIKAHYNINYHPRVVRQNRNLSQGQMGMLDYAVPCFELAAKLGIKNVNQVANEIADRLQKESERVGSSLTGYIIKTLHGYINIDIPNEVIRAATIRAAEWLKKPYAIPSFDSHKDIFLVIHSPSLEMSNPNLAHLTISYLSQVYAFSGRKQKAIYLYPDASEKINLSAQLSHDSLLNLMPQAHASLTCGVRTGDEPLQTLARRRMVGLKYSDQFVEETSFTGSANTYLNKFIRSTRHKEIILDLKSSAVYFQKGPISFALRSSKGSLHSSAYLLYMFDKLLQQREDVHSKIIVVAPQQLHDRLRLLVRLLAPHRGSIRGFHCFDPRILSADLNELQSRGRQLSRQFDVVRSALLFMDNDWLDVKEKRHALLSLVDMPAELIEQVRDLQLPSVFDTLNQSNELLALLDH